MNQILPPRPGSRWEKICSKFDQRRARRREEEQPQCIERDRSPQNYMTQVDNRPGFGPLPENDNPFAHYEQYPLFLDTDYFAPRWDLDEDLARQAEVPEVSTASVDNNRAERQQKDTSSMESNKADTLATITEDRDTYAVKPTLIDPGSRTASNQPDGPIDDEDLSSESMDTDTDSDDESTAAIAPNLATLSKPPKKLTLDQYKNLNSTKQKLRERQKTAEKAAKEEEKAVENAAREEKEIAGTKARDEAHKETLEETKATLEAKIAEVQAQTAALQANAGTLSTSTSKSKKLPIAFKSSTKDLRDLTAGAGKRSRNDDEQSTPVKKAHTSHTSPDNTMKDEYGRTIQKAPQSRKPNIVDTSKYSVSAGHSLPKKPMPKASTGPTPTANLPKRPPTGPRNTQTRPQLPPHGPVTKAATFQPWTPPNRLPPQGSMTRSSPVRPWHTANHPPPTYTGTRPTQPQPYHVSHHSLQHPLPPRLPPSHPIITRYSPQPNMAGVPGFGGYMSGTSSAVPGSYSSGVSNSGNFTPTYSVQGYGNGAKFVPNNGSAHAYGNGVNNPNNQNTFQPNTSIGQAYKNGGSFNYGAPGTVYQGQGGQQGQQGQNNGGQGSGYRYGQNNHQYQG